MPKARRKAEAAEPEGPSKAWLDSYADAMTLLLAFFILLYASSIIDEDLFLEFKVGVADALGQPAPAIEGGLGVLDDGNGVTNLVAPLAVPAEEPAAQGETDESDELGDEVTRENAKDLVEELETLIEEVGANPYVDVVEDPRGVILRLDSKILFRSGQALVLPDGVVILDAVAEVVAGIDNLMVVEGHTDNVPTDGVQWPSNWELSVARATNVLRYLVEVEGVPPVRISAAGYSDTRPKASNDTEDGRAENRRIEIIVVIQPYPENLIPVGEDVDIPSADAFGTEPIVPSEPAIGFDGLLDLAPDPVDLNPDTTE